MSEATTQTKTANNSNRSRKALAIVALLIAGGAFGMLALGDIGENLVYYYSPTELMEKREQAQGASVRLGGLVAVESIQQQSGAELADGQARQGDQLFLRFAVTDGETSVPVEARAVPPAMFREGIGVVVEGELRADGVFETRRLMVKHDNEYRAPEEGEEKSMKRLLETMQFNTQDT